MLFRKKMERSCAYCVFGTKMSEDEIICSKRGIRTAQDKCRRFRYDPCKRVPHKAKPLDFSMFQDEDFSLK